jgi:hypothetical protein
VTTVTVDRGLEGRKVRITRTDGDPLEGRAEAISRIGILLKVKGKSSTQLILQHEIADNGVLLIEESTDITQSVLQPVKLANVRRHLTTSHGWPLSEVNKLNDQEAFDQHTRLHEAENAADLGHRHEVKADDSKTKEEAEAENEADAASSDEG